MQKTTDLAQLIVVCKLFLQPVLHRLHIVIGGALDFLHPGGIGLAEPGFEFSQGRQCRVTQRDFSDPRFGREMTQPDQFYPDAIADQPVLAESAGERFGFACITPVHRRNCGQ